MNVKLLLRRYQRLRILETHEPPLDMFGADAVWGGQN